MAHENSDSYTMVTPHQPSVKRVGAMHRSCAYIAPRARGKGPQYITQYPRSHTRSYARNRAATAVSVAVIGQKSVRPKIATFGAHTVGYLCIRRTSPPTPQHTAAHPLCTRAAHTTLRRDTRHGTLTTDGCDAACMRSGVSRRDFRGAPAVVFHI